MSLWTPKLLHSALALSTETCSQEVPHAAFEQTFVFQFL